MEEKAARKLCPINGFKPCRREECAWFYYDECAIASIGWVDLTLQAGFGVKHMQAGEEE